MIWISAAGKLPLLICSVYLPYNLCSSTADRIFLSWHALTVPNFRVLVGGCTCSSPAEQHCWIAVVGSASDNPTGDGSQPISRAGILHSSFKSVELSAWKPKACIAVLWLQLVYFHTGRCTDQPSVPSVIVLLFRCIWDEDKCCPWSRDLPSFLLRVAFGINWYQEQSLSLNVEKINTLQWSWQPCSLV